MPPSTEQVVDVNGARLWTVRHGVGPPLILLHGGPGLWDYFDELAPMIDDLVEVHRYDQRGGGRSDCVPPFDVATLVADLDALRAYWGHERWIVAGHSWGAALALAYAVEHPQRVDALVHIDGTGVIDDWHDDYHTNADARRTPEQRERRRELRARVEREDEGWGPELDREYCVLSWMTDYIDRDHGQELASRLLRPYGPNYAVNTALSEDWARILAGGSFAERVGEIVAPTLIIHGAEDPRPPRLAERLAASMPNATLAIIPEAGHLPGVEQPGQMRDTLRAFLTEVDRTAHAKAAR